MGFDAGLKRIRSLQCIVLYSRNVFAYRSTDSKIRSEALNAYNVWWFGAETCFDFERKTTKPIKALWVLLEMEGVIFLVSSQEKATGKMITRMATRADEIDAAIQVAISRLTEITTRKSTYFFDRLEKC